MQHFLLSLCLAATLGVAEARIPNDMGDPIAFLITQNNGDYPVGNRGPIMNPALLSSGLWQVVFYLSEGMQYRREFMI